MADSMWLDGEMGLTNKIKQAMYDICKTFVYIGFLLDEANRCEYYRDHGHSSIYEYARQELGFKKSSVKNFMAVARTFGARTKHGTLCMYLEDQYKDFNYSQLVEMLSMSEPQRKAVNPATTVREIRAIKHSGQTSGRRVSECGQTSGQPDQACVIHLSVRLSPALYREITCYLKSMDEQKISEFVESCTWSVISERTQETTRKAVEGG